MRLRPRVTSCRNFRSAKSYSGINQNYSWGQDNWRDFQLAMTALSPKVTMDKELMPKLFAGEFGAEISAAARRRLADRAFELLRRRSRDLCLAVERARLAATTAACC